MSSADVVEAIEALYDARTRHDAARGLYRWDDGGREIHEREVADAKAALTAALDALVAAPDRH